MVVTAVGQRRPSADVNIIVVSLDDHNIVGVLRPMMMIVVITVMIVVVAVVGIREGGATTEGDVAVHPLDVNVRSGPGSSLCRLLCYSFGRGGMLVRWIAPRQKRGEIFWG